MCPVCSVLFMDKSEHDDHRPLVACVNSDTICADCYNKYRDGKCPKCDDALLPTPPVNKTLMKLIKNCATVLEISFAEIQMQKEPIAGGGFGQVYEAKWSKREQMVVVKVIKTTKSKEAIQAANCEAIQAANCEASLTLRLNHPNVIKLFGITYLESKKHGIVMEKADRGSLDKWIGKISHDKLTKIALDIIVGLKYVHSQHVIHRDIKPQNILMFGPENDMFPKIADFGVSKVIETVKGKHTPVGQPNYMALEVRFNTKYSFTADIYSLAITLFEMFNEQLIKVSPEEVKLFIMAVNRGKISNIPQSCKVPVYLRNVIERGWSENPEERPSLDEYRSTLQG